MLPDKETGCHRTGFKETCFEMVTQRKCRLWEHIIGTDPQTGKDVDEYGCADAHRNFLLIENSKVQAETASSVQSLRNLIDNANRQTTQMMHDARRLQYAAEPAALPLVKEGDYING